MKHGCCASLPHVGSEMAACAFDGTSKGRAAMIISAAAMSVSTNLV